MVKEDISEGEEYELMPHKEIEELKDELRKLKEFEITPTKKLKVSLLELNTKLDKLLKIFDEAQHTIKTEEMGMTFKERMRPVIDKMDKILEQNADIAEGIVAIADIVKEMRGESEEGIGMPEPEIRPRAPMPPPGPAPGMLPPGMPPPRGPMPPPARPPMPGVPPPPMPRKRKRTFGII